MKILKALLIAAIISAPIATLVAEGKTSTGNIASQDTGKANTDEKVSAGRSLYREKQSTGEVKN